MSSRRVPDEGVGDELDLEAMLKEATRIRRRALDLGFDEVIPEEGPSPGAAAPRRHGAADLDADAFLTPAQREARARVEGRTPTLDRLGALPRPRGLLEHGPRMDTELRLYRSGLPRWAWALLLALLLAGLAGGGVAWLRPIW